MKTNLVEIFQTIRATLQPYAALGFDAAINTETQYKLSSEKISFSDLGDEYIIFADLFIESNQVICCLFDNRKSGDLPFVYKDKLTDYTTGCKTFNSINDQQIKELEEILSVGFKLYKTNNWV